MHFFLCFLPYIQSSQSSTTLISTLNKRLNSLCAIQEACHLSNNSSCASIAQGFTLLAVFWTVISKITEMHSNVKINRSRISTSLDGATPSTAVVLRTDLLKKVSDHPQGKWCQNTDSEQSTRWRQNRNQITASNRDSRLQIHSTHTHTHTHTPTRIQIHHPSINISSRKPPICLQQTYYLKSAFHSDQETELH